MIYSDIWQYQKDFISAALTAAAVPGGALAPLAAANSGGIEQICPPASEYAPVLGWQFRSSSPMPSGQNIQTVTCVFEFYYVVAAGFDDSKPDVAQQAATLAEESWNDRAGNGLGPVLLADPTLGGNCTYSTARMAIAVGRRSDDPSDTTAVVAVTLTTIATGVPVFR